MRSLPPQMRIPTFKQINRVLSAGWGAAIVALGVSRLIASVITEHSTGSHRLPDLLFGTAIPVVIIVYMLKFSADYPKRVTAHTAEFGQNARVTISRHPVRLRVRPNRLTPGRRCAVLYAMDRHLTPPGDDARRRAAAGACGLCSSCCCR